jgi:hypothetical protein
VARGEAIAAAPALSLDSAARNEFRSQMIQPLALGGDSGRRMAATRAVAPLAYQPARTSVQMTATLAQGDSLARMLMRAGVSDSDAGAVMTLLAGVTAAGGDHAGNAGRSQVRSARC